MKTYRGFRNKNGACDVFVSEGVKARKLRKRLDLMNHSPTGFEWGYHGSGPAQLALAILADALDDDERAVRLHQQFKFTMIGVLPRSSGWTLPLDMVLRAVEHIEREEGNNNENS